MFKRATFGVFVAMLVFAAPATPNRTEKEYAEYTFARVEFSMNGAGFNGEGQYAWEHDYPFSEDFFLSMVAQVTGVHTNPKAYQIVGLDSPELFRYPFIYFSEPGFLDMSDAEVKNLREYFNRGGFAMFDDFRGRALVNLDSQMQMVFPERRMERMDLTEQVFHTFFDIDTLDMPPPYVRGDSGKPSFWGMKDETGRVILMANADNDFGEYWEDIDNGSEALRPAVQSFEFGVNYLIYAMTH